MKSAIWLTTSTLILALLPGCVEPPPPPLVRSDAGPGIGPFDANGNYREEWADDPSKWKRPSSLARRDSPPSNANPLPPRNAGASASSGSSSSKPASRPRPSVTRHTVKRGDTLSGIARKYGSSVSAIRRANGISGHLIYPGQRLIVPKR